MITKAECYIKGKDSNTKKKARDIKDYVPNAEGSYQYRKSNYNFPIMGKTIFKRVGKTVESFTPLNTRREQIWHEIIHLHNIHMPLAPKTDMMGPKPCIWCKLHTVKGHHIEDRYQLKKEIRRLVYKEHFKMYIKGDSSRGSDKSSSCRRDDAGSPSTKKAKEASIGKANKVV